MANVVVMGCGMVGSVMATDLAREPGLKVTAVDANPEARARASERAKRLGVPLTVAEADLGSASEIRRLLTTADLACGAMASRLAFAALKTVIEAGKPYCDISFMGEDAWDLDELAKTKGVTAVVDIGVAPGMSHVLAARAAADLDVCHSVAMYVGGLPVERRWPFEYKAAFSPADVIEEYTRPARLVENHAVVVREALSEPELMDFPGVGTLEAFNTDGLRSMAASYLGVIANMKEKTLRYPGHIERMRMLRAIGLMDETEVEVKGAGGRHTSVRPRDLLAKLMFPQWTYQPGEADLTVMRVEASGVKAGQTRRVRYDVLDYADLATGSSSMSRTTAFPCAIMAREVLAGRYTRPGVVTPEFLGQDAALTTRLLAEQAHRGVAYHRSETTG